MRTELPANSPSAPVEATALDLLQALVNTVTEAPGLAQIPVSAIKSVKITPDGFQVKYLAPLAGVNAPERQHVTLTASVDRWMDIPLMIPATPLPTTPAPSTEQEPIDMPFDADDAIIQAATYVAPPTPVTATEPTVAENVITIPTKEGVIYSVEDAPVTGTIALEEDDEVTVTASAAPGYVLSGISSWTFQYVAPDTDPDNPDNPEEPEDPENP